MKKHFWNQTGAILLCLPMMFLILFMPQVGNAKELKVESSKLEVANSELRAESSKFKSDSHDLASEGTDPGLYIIRLSDLPLATYEGGIPEFSATHPRSIGKKRLDVRTPASKAYRKHLSDKQDQLTAFMKKNINPLLNPIYKYEVVFNGMALRLTPGEAAEIAKLPEVVSVHQDRPRRMMTDTSPAFINANAIWDGSGTCGQPGTKGEGIIVGIIDSGIWPEHPSFADDGSYPPPPVKWGGKCTPPADGTKGYSCNNKLIGIQYFLKAYLANKGDNYDGLFHSGRDDNGHGTHISATAAGNENVPATIYGIDRGMVSGMAPRAHIASYKATGPGGGVTSDLLAAIDKAVADGVDVINYSIGNEFASDPWKDPDAQAFLAAREAGVFVVVSAGNNGPDMSTIGSPANAPWVTTVGASYFNRLFLSDIEIQNSESEIRNFYGASPTRGISDFNLVDTEGIADVKGDTSGYCLNPFPTGTFRSTDAVLCKRGEIATAVKGNFVQDGGAGAILLYNDENSYDLSSFPYPIPSVLVLYEKGLEIKEFIAQSTQPPTIRFTQGEPFFSPDPRVPVDTVLGLSSRGPAITESSPDSLLNIVKPINIIKPDLTAPGIHLLSAASPEWVDTIHGEIGRLGNQGEFFQIIQGTSMSSPVVAGLGALLKSLHPDWTPSEIQSALTITAVSQDHKARDASGDHPATPFDLGGGRVDVSRATRAGFVLHESTENFRAADPSEKGDPSALNLPGLTNAGCLGKCSWTRVLRSTSDISVNWTVSASDAEILTAEPQTFTLEPGGTQEIIITADVRNLTSDEWIFSEILFSPDASTVNGSCSDSDSQLQRTRDNGEETTGIKAPVSAHFPLAIRPLSGISPMESLEIETRRNQGVYMLKGLKAIGTDSLAVNAYFSEPEVFEGSLSQDSAHDDVYDDLNDGVSVRLVNASAGIKSLLIELAAASDVPDFDMYVGIDDNADGTPSADEERCKSAGTLWYETCEFSKADGSIEAGTYWVLVQNWRGTEAPEDKFTLAITRIDENSKGNVTASGPETVLFDEPFDINVFWNIPEFQVGDIKKGWLEVGTEAAHPDNILSMPLSLLRIQDDVTISLDTGDADAVRPGDIVTCTLRIQPDTVQGDDVSYTLRNTLPKGMRYIPGSATIEPDEINGNELLWSLEKIAEYRMSTNQDDFLCDTAYINLEEYGIFPKPGIKGDDIVIRFDEYYGGIDPVSFFGETYPDGLWLTDNGFVFMDSAPGVNPGENTGIPNTAAPNNLIAPFWRDLEIVYDATANRGVTVAGTPGDVTMIIEYDDVEPAPAGSTDERFDFEIIMSRIEDDTPGAYEIVFAYDNIRGTSVPATIGIENADGRQGLQYAYNDAEIEDGLTICFDWVKASTIRYQVMVEADAIPPNDGVSPPIILTNRVEHTIQTPQADIGHSPAIAETYVKVAEAPFITADSGEIGLPIPDEGDAVSSLEITKKAAITDVNVILNIRHPNIEDLRAYLISPFGTSILLFENLSGPRGHLTGTTLDDEAEIAINSSDIPFIGEAFQPAEPLSALLGEPAEGEWTLRLYDDNIWDEGTLISWGLEIGLESAKPIANEDMAVTAENEPVVIEVLDNDTDPDGDTSLTIVSVSAPSHGTATHDGAIVSYTPNPGFVGEDSFTYTITDNSDGTAEGNIFVTVEKGLVSIVVTTLADVVDDDGELSLREAILAAGTNQSIDGSPQGGFRDNIILPEGVFTLGPEGTLKIISHLSLIGSPDGGTVLEGNGEDQILHIQEGADVSLENITVRGGGKEQWSWVISVGRSSVSENRRQERTDNEQQTIRIVGGDEAEPGTWPWMAALVRRGSDAYSGQFCGGSLIHPEWVLTAAHCVESGTENDFDVIIGVHNLSKDEGDRIEVDAIIIHPNYDSESLDSDIALLHLSAPSDRPYVNLIPPGDPTDIAAAGTLATVVGWGATESGGVLNPFPDYPETLFQVSVPIVSNETARISYASLNESPGAITETMLAAGYEDGGKDSCTGDSGSPLMVDLAAGGWDLELDTQIKRQNWVQAGIVSWGKGCARAGYYGLYTRLSLFTDWIYDEIDWRPVSYGLKGGGILNEGTLTISRSTLVGNVAANGGAICNSGVLTLLNSTLSGNSATLGGGLYNEGVVKLIFSTVTENAADMNGGGLFLAESGEAELRNTLIAGNTADVMAVDIMGDVISRGGNLIGDSNDSRGYQSNDLLDADPLLVPLMDNGGPSLTYAIQANGPAVDVTDCTDIDGMNVEADQRGAERGGRCDIGAFEYDGNDYPPVAVDDIAFTIEKPVTINVLDNDRDANGDKLSVVSVSIPENGVVTTNEEISILMGLAQTPLFLTYTPNEGFVGTDRFTYTISDGEQTSEASVTVMTQADNLPVVGDDEVLIRANTRVSIEVLSNDSDPEGEPLTVTDVAEPAYGSASTDGVTVTYVPERNFVGTDHFMYRVTDGSKMGKAFITVTVGDLSKCHNADYNPRDYEISLSELLRVIQLYNNGHYKCGDADIEDGYDLQGSYAVWYPFGFVEIYSSDPISSYTYLEDGDDLQKFNVSIVEPGDLFGSGDFIGDYACTPHDSDYNPQDWQISLSEFLRVVQFYNSSGYHLDENGEDGFAPEK